MKEIAKIVLINGKNEFLFQLRDEDPNIIFPGQWALIGGGIEKDENPLKGLLREIEEEIPDCKVFDVKYLESFFYNPAKTKNFLFKGNINEEIEYINKKLTEGQKVGYFEFNELGNIKLNYVERDFIYKNKDLIMN